MLIPKFMAVVGKIILYFSISTTVAMKNTAIIN